MNCIEQIADTEPTITLGCIEHIQVKTRAYKETCYKNKINYTIESTEVINPKKFFLLEMGRKAIVLLYDRRSRKIILMLWNVNTSKDIVSCNHSETPMCSILILASSGLICEIGTKVQEEFIYHIKKKFIVFVST